MTAGDLASFFCIAMAQMDVMAFDCIRLRLVGCKSPSFVCLMFQACQRGLPILGKSLQQCDAVSSQCNWQAKTTTDTSRASDWLHWQCPY